MQGSPSYRSSKLTNWSGQRFVRWAWWVIGALWLSLIIVEFFEVPLASGDHFSREILPTLILFTVTWVMLGILLFAHRAKFQAYDLLELKHQLSIQLALAADWDNLVEVIFAFCRRIIDLDSVFLLVRAPQIDAFEVVAQWEAKLGRGSPVVPADIGYTCSIDKPGALHPIKYTDLVVEASNMEPREGYCLFLQLGDNVVAELILYLAAGRNLNAEQANILNGVSCEMATALAAAQRHEARIAITIDRAVSEQRRHLARDMHDTLGQKLAYLRLKLDQFASDPETYQLGSVGTDLVQMRQVANESSELVRGTLAVLGIGKTPFLLDLLIGHSRTVRARTGLAITFDETGQPLTLPADLIQEIFYIFSEALSNVEKHAGAAKVDVELVWTDEDLLISIIDDGQGFCMDAAPTDGHYGLAIMRQRAEGLGGCLDLCSTPGHGTRVIVRLPIGTAQDHLIYGGVNSDE